jgi:serine/threonine-protein kinase
MIQCLKEGVQKMICEDKTYTGNNGYKFRVKFDEEHLVGEGGNGKVWNAEILHPQKEGNYVVKFLSLEKWQGTQKKLRYERFKKEIMKILDLQKDTIGIMTIIDYNCPNLMLEGEEVWYLMPKAVSFQEYYEDRNQKYTIKEKIEDILYLAKILSALHMRRISHRDIKPANLLFLNNQLVLSDFGLIWEFGDKHLTANGENVGPYLIRPPELENPYTKYEDYCLSDVYLFSKVMWMIIKEKKKGFSKRYNRGDKYLYLDPSVFKVFTFEPLHQLLGQATEDKMSNRINMIDCRKLLEKQLVIINGERSEEVDQLRRQELDLEIVNYAPYDELTYLKFYEILEILKKFLPVSKIIIEGASEEVFIDTVSEWDNDEEALVFNKNINDERLDYLCYPDHLKRSEKKREFELHLKSVQKQEIHSEFISYRESKKPNWGHKNEKNFFNEELILRIPI